MLKAPLKEATSILFFSLLCALPALPALPALAADSGPGKCGGAPYKKDSFAKKLTQVKSRTASLCKQQKAAASKLTTLAKSCKDADLISPVNALVDRGAKLCEKGPKAIDETVKLCQDYDKGMAKNVANLDLATKGTDSQSSAFTKRGTALASAGSQMNSVASSAGAVSKRIHSLLPAKQAGASSDDKEIKKSVAKFEEKKKAKQLKSASCKELNQNFSQLATLLQQNLMPNLRVLQEGVEGIQKNAQSSAQGLNKGAFDDNATAAKLAEPSVQAEREKQMAARNKPLNQENPNIPAAASKPSAINDIPRLQSASKDQADAFAADAARKTAIQNNDQRMTFKAFEGNLTP